MKKKNCYVYLKKLLQTNQKEHLKTRLELDQYL